MLHNQFAAAVADARSPKALDEIARLCWRAHAEAQLSDADAEAVAEAVQARRTVFRTILQPKPAAAPPAPRQPPRSPDKQASLERRRRWVASGAMPPQLAAAFTMAEVATLAVIARQVQQHGQCRLPIDALAALAGCSRSSVKNAVRQAKTLGLIEVAERRRAGQRSLTNIIKIIAPAWAAWLKLSIKGGGVKKMPSTNTRFLKTVSQQCKMGAGGEKIRDPLAFTSDLWHSSAYVPFEKEASKCTNTKPASSA